MSGLFNVDVRMTFFHLSWQNVRPNLFRRINRDLVGSFKSEFSNSWFSNSVFRPSNPFGHFRPSGFRYFSHSVFWKFDLLGFGHWLNVIFRRFRTNGHTLAEWIKGRILWVRFREGRITKRPKTHICFLFFWVWVPFRCWSRHLSTVQRLLSSCLSVLIA